MRFSLPAIAALALAACASDPKPTPISRPAPEPAERGTLVGLSAGDLAAQFGTPRFQQREGDGTKLQFAGNGCVLDAYLYPAPGKPARVTHVDTRDRDGRSVDQAGCIALIKRR